jgi:hypothetical protein
VLWGFSSDGRSSGACIILATIATLAEKELRYLDFSSIVAKAVQTCSKFLLAQQETTGTDLGSTDLKGGRFYHLMSNSIADSWSVFSSKNSLGHSLRLIL